MISRITFIALLVALVVASTQAFAPAIPVRVQTGVATTTALESCRTNAKKEKIKRNRENMRKFKGPTGGRGRNKVSRRKLMKKALASKARQDEAEFIAKCYITVSPPNSEEDDVKK